MISLGQKIRTTRESKGLSLRKLAKEIGVSPSFVSQVEQNKAKPSVKSLKNMAEVLGVNCSYLIGEESTFVETSEPIIKKKNRFDPEQLQQVSIKKLVPENIDNNLEPSLLSLAPGASSSLMSAEQGEDFLLMLAGEIEITLGEQNYSLREGDNIYFNPVLRHSFRNKSDKTAKILWVKAS